MDDADLAFQRTQSCIQRPSTYQSSIIFSGNKCWNKRSNWSMFPPRNKLLIYSPNHCPGRHLNTSDRSWGLLMHHPAIESCLLYAGGYTYICRSMWVEWVYQRSSGIGSGGAYILLMMHCWHYLRSPWFDFSRVFWWSRSMCAGLKVDSADSCSCLYVMYFFSYQGHVTAYFGFPTMPGMNDVMYFFI